jgi:hypothetical protein
VVEADSDGDDLLSQVEYVALVNSFTAVIWEGLGYDTLGSALKALFDHSMEFGSSLISIKGSKPEDEPTEDQKESLEGFCKRLEAAIDQARDSEIFFQQCKLSLRNADNNEDGLLSEEEYVPFLYDLADKPSKGIQFGDLNQVLELNYNLIKLRKDIVDISGLTSSPTKEQAENFRWICKNTQDVMGAIDGDGTAVVYNAFVISNIGGISAADLRAGKERSVLETSYDAFVEEEIAAASSSHLRGRRLIVLGVVPSSTQLYQIDDLTCPSSLGGSIVCQTVYGSFAVIVADEDDLESVSESLSRLTQEAIDNGNLQKQLSSLAEDSLVKIESSSEPLQPPGKKPPDVESNDNESGIGPIIIIVVAAACVFLGVVLYLWFFVRKRSGGRDEKEFEGGSHVPTIASTVPADSTDDDDFHGKSRAFTLRDDEDGSSAELELKLDIPEQRPDNNTFGAFHAEKENQNNFVHNQEPNMEESSFDATETEELIDVESPESSEGSEERQDADNFGFPAQQEKGLDFKIDESPQSEFGSESGEETPANPFDSFGFSRQLNNEPAADPFATSHASDVDWATSGDPWGTERQERTTDDFIEDKDSFSEKSDDENVDESSRASEDRSIEDTSQSAKSDDGSKEAPIEEEEEEASDAEGASEEEESSEGEESDGGETSEASEGESESGSEKTENEYRSQVESLVRKVVPDEIDNIDAMMEQFVGREEELIATLKNMAGDVSDNDVESEDEGSSESEEDDESDEEGGSQEEESEENGETDEEEGSQEEESEEDDEPGGEESASSEGDEEETIESAEEEETIEEESVEEVSEYETVEESYEEEIDSEEEESCESEEEEGSSVTDSEEEGSE